MLWLPQQISAQSYSADIQRISIEDGLSNRFVTVVFQDSFGFAWIGTQFGLNRYDGYKVISFLPEDNGISDKVIESILEDDRQRLWVTYNGNNDITVIDLKTLEIKLAKEIFEDFPFDQEEMRHIGSSVDGSGIFFSLEGGKIYRLHNDLFELIYDAQHNDVRFLHADKDYMLLYLYGKEVQKVNYQGEVLLTHVFRRFVLGMGVDEKKRPWIFEYVEDDYLHRVNEEGEIEKVDLERAGALGYQKGAESYHLFRMSPEGKIVYWHRDTGGQKQTFRITHPEEGLLLDLTEEIESYFTYATPRIVDMHLAHDGRIWLGTDDGVLIIDIRKAKFRKLLTEDGGRSTRGIIKDDFGNLYISCLNGSVIIDPDGNISPRSDSYSLGAFKDVDGNLWFSQQNPYMVMHNPRTGEEFDYHYLRDGTPKPWSQWTIFRDKHGKVWTGGSSGIYTYTPGDEYMEDYHQYNQWPFLDMSYIYHYTQEENGLWISAGSGLYFLEYGKGIVKHFGKDEEAPFHIPVHEVMHHHIDAEGIFWLATKGGGLIRLNIDTGENQQFTTRDGLSNEVLYAVYEDDYNQLWLPSNNGLMRFDKTDFTVKTFLEGDGITHNEFNTASHYRDEEGLLYFGGLKGVTVVNPADFVENPEDLVIPLHITSAQVLNGKTGELADYTAELSKSQLLTVNPSDKSVVLEFSLLNYENSYQNTYAYKLEGLDADWNYIQENSLRLNSLPYGSYNLLIKGRGSQGMWSARELRVQLEVIRPFYKQAWFVVICVLLGIALIIGVFRWRVKSLKENQIKLQQMVDQRTRMVSDQKDRIAEQAEKLKTLDKTKSRFFANISHELRTPLTLILGYLGKTLNNEEEVLSDATKSGLKISKRNGERLLNLTEEILDLSKLEAGELKIKLKPIRLHDFLSRIIDGYQSFVSQKKVVMEMHFSPDSDIVINMDEPKLDKILNNLVSNAAKYTDAGQGIRISVDSHQNNDAKTAFTIKVNDTGRGIHPDDLPHVFDRFYQSNQADAQTEGGTGIGLALAKELAELLGGTLSCSSVLGEGSEFVFEFMAEVVDSTIVKHMKTELQYQPPPSEFLLEEDQFDLHSEKEPGFEGKPRVLLAEDNHEMRAFIREILTPYYKVEEAVDGQDAIEFLEKDEVDLVVSDVMMPRMDGFGLLGALRESKKNKELPVMMLTARAADEDKMRAFTIGVDDYLTKPFSPNELLARVKNLIHNRNQRKVEEEKEELSQNGLSAFDQQFVARAQELVEAEISNTNFGIIDMAEALNVSQRQLTRKMNRTTGLSPLNFIREVKLQRARAFLENKEKQSVAEVMYAVGIQSTGYFAKIYAERFGKRPSEYLASSAA